MLLILVMLRLISLKPVALLYREPELNAVLMVDYSAAAAVGIYYGFDYAQAYAASAVLTRA